jgi:hypothetical protein
VPAWWREALAHAGETPALGSQLRSSEASGCFRFCELLNMASRIRDR